MQTELDAVTTLRPIRILGINEIGHESANTAMTAGRVLPWMQATAAVNVWQLWQVTFRDVIVVNGRSERVTAYNLTTQDLAVAGNYAALKNILLEEANRAE